MSKVAFWSLICLLGFGSVGQADPFDYHFNTDLIQVPKAKGVKKAKRLTVDLLADVSGLVKGTTGAFLVVKTNENRWAKLMVFPARQRLADGKTVPILLIEKFVTYRAGEERRIECQGENIRLFGNFIFNLDMGQVVPASVGGDIRFVGDKGKPYAEPVGEAEFFLLTKAIATAKADTSEKVVAGKVFIPGYFNGTYKIEEDGRRTGTLKLQVEKDGKVLGYYFSDKDGNKYAVEGKIGSPNHRIDFRIMFPQTTQFFRGWMFTGDAAAIAGSARMQQRETGFYATRLVKEEK